MGKHQFSANELLQALRRGCLEVLDEVYDLHQADFFAWAGKRFQVNDQDLEDAWQDAVIAFYEKTVSEKLTSLRCELRTFLFAIGYKILLKNHRKMKRIIWRDSIDDALRKEPQIIAFEWDDPWLEERRILRDAMYELSPQCRELLIRKYYHENTVAEIMVELEYTTLNSVSASSSRCLKKLKEIIENKLRQKGRL